MLFTSNDVMILLTCIVMIYGLFTMKKRLELVFILIFTNVILNLNDVGIGQLFSSTAHNLLSDHKSLEEALALKSLSFS